MLKPALSFLISILAAGEPAGPSPRDSAAPRRSGRRELCGRPTLLPRRAESVAGMPASWSVPGVSLTVSASDSLRAVARCSWSSRDAAFASRWARLLGEACTRSDIGDSRTMGSLSEKIEVSLDAASRRDVYVRRKPSGLRRREAPNAAEYPGSCRKKKVWARAQIIRGHPVFRHEQLRCGRWLQGLPHSSEDMRRKPAPFAPGPWFHVPEARISAHSVAESLREGSARRSHGEEMRAACRSRTDMPILRRGRGFSPARWSSRRTRRGRMRGSGADAVRPNRWHWRTRSCSFPWNMSGPLRRAANDVWRSAAKQGNRRTEGPTSPGRSLVACLSLGCAPQAAAVVSIQVFQ